MKSRILLRMMVCLLFLHVFFTGVLSQTSAENQPPSQSETQPLGEDERIPFMQSDETAKQSDVGGGSLILRTFGAMLLIVGLIFFGAWILKRSGYGASPAKMLSDAPELVLLTSVSMGNGKTISTVRFGEKILLVGATAQSFTLLAEDFKTENLTAETGEEFNFQNPRSVAELLAEENFDFESEFANARERLRHFEEKGERI